MNVQQLMAFFMQQYNIRIISFKVVQVYFSGFQDYRKIWIKGIKWDY
jgi:hypothetical protein